MIQRIQSVYLFIVAVLSLLTVGMPVAGFINESQHLSYLMDSRGVSLILPNGVLQQQSTTWLLTTFAMMFGVMAVITLFSYKQRMKQIRLSVINFFFMISYYIMLGIEIWMACRTHNAEVYLRSTVAMPLVAMVFNYLAIGAIGKDEKLVRSTERLR